MLLNDAYGVQFSLSAPVSPAMQARNMPHQVDKEGEMEGENRERERDRERESAKATNWVNMPGS